MKVALITIATGNIYRRYASSMIESAHKYFPEHDMFVFTDDPAKMNSGFSKRSSFYTEAKGFPRETLLRYKTILNQEWRLDGFDQIFYVDADMKFVAPVSEDIFSDGLTATLHPGYIGTTGTPEFNPDSLAYCNKNTAYYCGGFQGGNAKAYIKAMKVMRTNIDEDALKGITAVWHDESHWNKYLADFPPAKVLGPEYCYPNVPNNYYRDKWKAAGLTEVKPILLALTKDSK